MLEAASLAPGGSPSEAWLQWCAGLFLGLALMVLVLWLSLYARQRYHRYHAPRYSGPTVAWTFGTVWGVMLCLVEYAGGWPWLGLWMFMLTAAWCAYRAARLLLRSQWRYEQRDCGTCGATGLVWLEAAQAYAALSDTQRADEDQDVAHHDVFRCRFCGATCSVAHAGSSTHSSTCAP